MIIFVKKSKESIKNLLELVNEFKVYRYKINILKSKCISLYKQWSGIEILNVLNSINIYKLPKDKYEKRCIKPALQIAAEGNYRRFK